MTENGPLVSVKTLREHLRDGGWRVVDCRFELAAPGKGQADYVAGHVPGAVYAHLDTDLAGPVGPATGRHPLPPPEDFIARLEQWGIGPQTRVVVYDQGGGAIAARLWWMLQWVGHPSAALLDGGYAAWLAADGEVSTDLPSPARNRYPAQADPGMVIDTPELLGLLRQGMTTPLLDARDPARFAGRTEPIDSKAGHVPGARNFPYAANLHEDGSWKDAAALRALWREALGEDGSRPWIAMCGSGVTACHLALSAAVAGYRAPRLYAGSWSEWIRDEERPIATDEPAATG